MGSFSPTIVVLPLDLKQSNHCFWVGHGNVTTKNLDKLPESIFVCFLFLFETSTAIHQKATLIKNNTKL